MLIFDFVHPSHVYQSVAPMQASDARELGKTESQYVSAAVLFYLHSVFCTTVNKRQELVVLEYHPTMTWDQNVWSNRWYQSLTSHR